MADLTVKNAKFIIIGGVKYNVGWSKNDLTDELKTKLEGIAEGAQVNVIEKIKLNGAEVSVQDKTIDLGNLQKALTVGAGLSLDAEGNLAITYDHTAFKLVDSLPAAPAAGDENRIHVVAGAQTEEGNLYSEHIYVGGKWEKLGEFKAAIDLTPYLTKAEAEQTYVAKVEGKGLSTEDYTTAEKSKLAAISEGANKVTFDYDEGSETLTIATA